MIHESIYLQVPGNWNWERNVSIVDLTMRKLSLKLEIIVNTSYSCIPFNAITYKSWRLQFSRVFCQTFSIMSCIVFFQMFRIVYQPLRSLLRRTPTHQLYGFISMRSIRFIRSSLNRRLAKATSKDYKIRIKCLKHVFFILNNWIYTQNSHHHPLSKFMKKS